jgi:hypothetical protein
MATEIPKIHVDLDKLMREDVDMLLMSKYDVFYRRIVEFVMAKIEGDDDEEVLAILVDNDGKEYEMHLPEQGYSKSIGKSMEYFLMIEEYETCELIKQIQTYLDRP